MKRLSDTAVPAPPAGSDTQQTTHKGQLYERHAGDRHWSAVDEDVTPDVVCDCGCEAFAVRIVNCPGPTVLARCIACDTEDEVYSG